MSDVPTFTLNNGSEMPKVGFGVFQIPADETIAAVTTALDAGYRSIDTAAIYGNEEAVGQALAQHDVPRDEIFVTTKVWNSEHGRDTTLRAYDASLERLGLETIDLYLIHWPSPAKDLYVETWQTLEELYRDGRVGAIGVSNFNIEHLQRLIDECEIVPTVNQVKLDPQFQQRALRAFHDEHDIRTEAWAPLGQGSPLLDDDVVVEIARAHDVDAGQIALRWSVQHGIVVIPKSVTPSRIRSNLDVFSFDLTDDEMTRLDGLYQDDRAFDPADMNF